MSLLASALIFFGILAQVSWSVGPWKKAFSSFKLEAPLFLNFEKYYSHNDAL